MLKNAYFSAASENYHIVSIAEKSCIQADVFFNSKVLVEANLFIVLIEKNDLATVHNHAMTCKAFNDQVCLIWELPQHFRDAKYPFIVLFNVRINKHIDIFFSETKACSQLFHHLGVLHGIWKIRYKLGVTLAAFFNLVNTVILGHSPNTNLLISRIYCILCVRLRLSQWFSHMIILIIRTQDIKIYR